MVQEGEDLQYRTIVDKPFVKYYFTHPAHQHCNNHQQLPKDQIQVNVHINHLEHMITSQCILKAALILPLFFYIGYAVDIFCTNMPISLILHRLHWHQRCFWLNGCNIFCTEFHVILWVTVLLFHVLRSKQWWKTLITSSVYQNETNWKGPECAIR